MDFDTRIAVRKQIDSVMRKRIGLRQIPHIAVIPQRNMRHGVWSDGDIIAALKRIAEAEECPVAEVRLADYRRHIRVNPGCAPSINTIKGRLLSGVAGCPERLQ